MADLLSKSARMATLFPPINFRSWSGIGLSPVLLLALNFSLSTACNSSVLMYYYYLSCTGRNASVPKSLLKNSDLLNSAKADAEMLTSAWVDLVNKPQNCLGLYFIRSGTY